MPTKCETPYSYSRHPPTKKACRVLSGRRRNFRQTTFKSISYSLSCARESLIGNYRTGNKTKKKKQSEIDITAENSIVCPIAVTRTLNDRCAGCTADAETNLPLAFVTTGYIQTGYIHQTIVGGDIDRGVTSYLIPSAKTDDIAITS